MSKQEAAEGREVVGEQMVLWSPMDLDGDLYFHRPPSPPSPGLCLSPLWNFCEDNHRGFIGEIHVMPSTISDFPVVFVQATGDMFREIVRKLVGRSQELPVLQVKSKRSKALDLSHTHVVDKNKQPRNQEVDFIDRKTKINEGERSLPLTISKKKDKLSLEDLKQLFGMSLQDAADFFGVSRSTMKRKCRELGIYRWPSYKRKMAGRFSHKQTRKNELLQGSDGAIFCNSQNLYPDSARAWPEQTQSAKKQKSQCSGELPSIVETRLENIASNVDAPTPKLSNGAAIQGERTAFIEIKAKYREFNIQFKLHYPSAFVDLETEVQKRLKLKRGTFTLQYLDADSDWILIACDEDLEDLLEVFFSKGIIKMLVEDINHL